MQKQMIDEAIDVIEVSDKLTNDIVETLNGYPVHTVLNILTGIAKNVLVLSLSALKAEGRDKMIELLIKEVQAELKELDGTSK